MITSVSCLPEAIQEMLKLMKALPPRPSVLEVDISFSTIADVNKSLADKQTEISSDQCPQDVPLVVFRALQEMRLEALTTSIKEQRLAAEAIVELEERYRRYDKWIQQAHSATLSPTTAREQHNEGRTGVRSSVQSVLDMDCGSDTDDLSNKSSLSVAVSFSKSQFSSSTLARSSSWSSKAQLDVAGGKLSRAYIHGGQTEFELPRQDALPVAQKDSKDATYLSPLTMSDVGFTQQKSTVLALRGVFLKEIEWVPESLGQMTQLTHLDLSGNRLNVLPESTANLCNLVHLNLSSNQLVILPEAVARLVHLQTLNIENNKLEELPVSIGQCSSLIEMKAGFNKLKALPEATGKLSNLQFLDVHLNNLTSLPTTMASMMRLTELDAHFNQLQAIPESLCQVTTLVKLNVSSNFTELKELPQQIGNLEKLKFLNLSCNQITMLPDSFSKLTNLQKLDLSGNPLLLPPQNVVVEGKEAVLKYMADHVDAKSKGLGVIKSKDSIWGFFSFFFICSQPSLYKEEEILA